MKTVLLTLLLCVECSDAFLQSQKTLVDLRSFKSSDPIVTLGVFSSLTSSQVDKHELS